MGASDADAKEFSIGNAPAKTNLDTVRSSEKQALQ
jgi:hypothetical protein